MNEEIKAASVDSSRLTDLMTKWADALPGKTASEAYEAIIAHINAWSDERCNQLAASRAMLPVTDSQIDRERVLGSELAIIIGCQDGRSSTKKAEAVVEWIKRYPLASPVAGWVSVEDAKDAARYRWLRMQDWFSGQLCVLRDPKRALSSAAGLGADCPSRDRLDAAIDAEMTVPPAPVVTPTPTEQEQNNG